MRLSQDAIRRMVGNGGGVVGGGGGSFDPSALAGYASQAWVEDNYISKLFFSRMFTANGAQKVYTSTDGGETWGTPVVTTVTIAPNEITPSETITDGETSGTKIKTVRELSSIQALVGLWTHQYLSALGQNSSGGGASALADLTDVALSSPTNGQALVYNATSGKWENQTIGGGGGGGTVTSITTGTGLTGGPITTSGTISINNTYQSYISHGETAYSWGDHAQAGYATPSSVASQMQTYAKIQNGTITIGDNSITPLTQHQTVGGTFWGQSWNNGGTVSGNMTGVGTIKMTGHLYMHEGGTGIYLNSDGTGIDWHDGSDSYVTSLLAFTSSMVTAHQGLTIPVNKSLRIGDGVLTWDAANNAFKVEKYDGTAANFYATGGVSALGVSTGGSVTNLTVSNNITVGNDLTLGGELMFGTNDASIYMDDYFYIESGSTVSINGVECYSGNVWLNRLYLDTTRYLYVSGGTLYYYNGSESKQIAFID